LTVKSSSMMVERASVDDPFVQAVQKAENEMSIPAGAQVSPTEAADLAAAKAGDAEAFRRLTQRYQRELHVHCYRMLGTIQDAEDAMQETWLRAWRHLGSFAGRSSFRSWLYRIATNVCLTAAARRRADPPPPAWLADLLAASTEPVIHLSPYPDAWLDELEAASDNPAARYELHESVELAFLAAIQLLPPRQRAVLILRDVLDWSAAEVAELLGATTASVNSALQRARATIERQRREGRLRTDLAAPPDAVEQSIVRRYIDTWEAEDIAGFVRLLRSDAVLTMPPLPLRYVGRSAIASFLSLIPTGSMRRSLRPTGIRANRQPVVANYMAMPGGQRFRAATLQVLSLDRDTIAAITAFPDRALYPIFGLPAELDTADT
jgi:RNA polymerase sigma-70 factor, ECF subfamily